MQKFCAVFVLIFFLNGVAAADSSGMVIRRIISMPRLGEVSLENRKEIKRVEDFIRENCGPDSGRVPMIMFQGVVESRESPSRKDAALKRAFFVKDSFSDGSLVRARTFVVSGSAWMNSLRQAGVSQKLASTVSAVYIEAGC